MSRNRPRSSGIYPVIQVLYNSDASSLILSISVFNIKFSKFISENETELIFVWSIEIKSFINVGPNCISRRAPPKLTIKGLPRQTLVINTLSRSLHDILTALFWYQGLVHSYTRSDDLTIWNELTGFNMIGPPNNRPTQAREIKQKYKRNLSTNIFSCFLFSENRCAK